MDTILIILTLLIVIDIFCKLLLQKYKIVKHEDHENLYIPKKRFFLNFYKTLPVKRYCLSMWDIYCKENSICTWYEAERVIREDKLK